MNGCGRKIGPYRCCTIVQGDCLPLMKLLPEKCIDVVITDPPYGVQRDKGFTGSRAFGGGRGVPIACRTFSGDWDKQRPSAVCFQQILRIGKLVLIFGGNFFADILPMSKHWIVWDKLNTMRTFGDCELIWTNSLRTSVKKYTVEWNGLVGKEASRDHPTQKPLKLLVRLVEDYGSGIVFDPYAGSGTTLVAAKKLGRHFLGFELDEKYCKIARERVARTEPRPSMKKQGSNFEYFNVLED